MSKESVQFVEMARAAIRRLEDRCVLIVNRHCEECGKFCDHESKQSGEWETITCRSCGAAKRYRTK